MTRSTRANQFSIPREKRAKTASRHFRSACYVANVSPVIHARFTIQPDTLTSCTIHATGGPFGGIVSTNVAFSAGDSGFVPLAAVGNTGDTVGRARFDLDWMAIGLEGDSFPAERVVKTHNHVLYTIFREPLSPWKASPLGDNQNAWASALDFALVTAGAAGKATETNALAAITQYLHSGHGMRYDTQPVALNFTQRMEGGDFDLTGYLTKSIQVPSQPIFAKDEVNCYDQAGALVVLGRLLGINVEYKYMTRFGYINPTALVDISPCNNPFYPITTSHEPMTGVDEVWPVRSSFGNHAFSMCDDLVYDACVGPVTGIPLNRYLDDSIDASTSEEELKSGKTSTPSTGIIEKSY